jgi:hypothetical protein
MYNQLAIEQLNEPLLYLQSWEFRLTLFYPSLYSKSFWIFGHLVTNTWYCTGGLQMVSSQLTPLPKLACTAAAAFLPQPTLTLEAVFDSDPASVTTRVGWLLVAIRQPCGTAAPTKGQQGASFTPLRSCPPESSCSNLSFASPIVYVREPLIGLLAPITFINSKLLYDYIKA